ncbi:hypothetical protein Bca52824_089015 [Brassica carinata]|uniref:Uncharacterized protein n=1 Tax=Brassica carinata TaxID=52824 RepID=A0A8X7PEU7_BRACI|nr:hypothetical protein Bca52824_089015 [Brassica carinata]
MIDVRNTGLTLTGGGTFDRQGAVAWPFNNCKLLPAVRELKKLSLKFVGMNRTIVRRISSVNSKFFHIALEPSKVKLSEIYFKNIRGTSSSRVAMEVESETQELHIHVNGEPERKSSTEQRSHNYSWRLRVSLYVILLLAGETIATLLGRLYYDKGGNSIWLETLVQLVGFPLTLPCYYYIKHESSSKNNNLTNKTTTSFLTLPLVYIGLGLLAAVSSLFSNVISTLCLPVVPVLAVVFFRDEMSGIKLIAMFLAIWGFVSYAYQHYVDDPKQEDEKEIPQGEEEEKETQEEKSNNIQD